MATTVTIPDLGEGVDSVDVVAVLVKVGDTIAVDQPLIEVETEKAAVEVPSTIAGTVTEIHVEAGQSLGPDAPVVTVEADDAGSEAEPSSESASASETAPPPAPAPAPDAAAATGPASAAASVSVAAPANSAGDPTPFTASHRFSTSMALATSCSLGPAGTSKYRGADHSPASIT